MRRNCVMSILAIAIFSAPVQADIFVGRIGAVSDLNIVSVFADGANGDPAPIRIIGGNTSTLQTCNGIAYNPGTGDLFIADFSGQAVRVFRRLTNGNVAPIRSITSAAFMGQPRDVVANPALNELYVITQLSAVSTFALDASGESLPIRSFGFSASQLDNPGYLAFSAQRNELFVSDYRQVGSQIDVEVLVFPRTATGGTTPIRFIRGNNTTLINGGNVSLAINDAAGELYIATNGLGTGAISTFAIDASGNISPIRRIAGPATNLNFDFGFIGALTYNSGNDTLTLTTELNGADPAIVTFARTADGNVAPLRRISGANSGSLNSFGWYSAEALDFDPVFRNGLE